jgi:hypothetical protein
MPIELRRVTEQFRRNAEIIRGLVSGIPGAEARWKPSPEKWSILEVVNHLDDEEREDFRQRLDLVLHRPGEPWPGIDPQGWVTSRRYADRDPVESLDRFLRERERSVAWLDGLGAPAWDNRREHPIAGTLRAGDLLHSWLAHDFLHIRQIARLRYEYVSHLAAPYSTKYAGGS